MDYSQVDASFGFTNLLEKANLLATYFFALGTIYFVVMVGVNGLKISKSGDDATARARAQSALWMNMLGGVIFFGATLVAGLYKWFATS